MNFKFDLVTFLIVLAGGLLLVAWWAFSPPIVTVPQNAPARQEAVAQSNGSVQPNGDVSQNDDGPADPAHAAEAGAAAAVREDAPEVETESQSCDLENELFRVRIDGLSGAISSVELKDDRFIIKDSDKHIELFPKVLHRTFELTVPGRDGKNARVSLKGMVRKGGLRVVPGEDGRSVVVERTFTNGLKLVQTFSLSGGGVAQASAPREGTPEEARDRDSADGDAKDDYLVTCKYVWSNPTSESVRLEKVGVGLAGLPQVRSLTGDKIYSERLNVDFCEAESGDCKSVNPQIKDETKYAERTACGNKVSWIGSTNKYFASLLFADKRMPFVSSSGERAWLLPEGSSNDKDRYAVPSMTGDLGDIAPAPRGNSVEFTLETYCGPKELSRIRKLDYPSVMKVMHIAYYSWFEFIARPMVLLLNWLKSICGSYGVAIILLTLIVRILCWPVTQKANSSMRRMQKIQPKIKALQEKYKETPMDTADDTARKKAELNQKMMELYRVEKVNPLGGCLPLILQIPIFIALYSALDSAVELYNVPFLWCKALSRPDQIGPTLPFALPILGQVGFHPLVIAMTVLMIVQQRMTPSAADSTQQKLMLFMPIIMLVMFYSLPSGLTLYWTVSQIFSILQMKYGQYAAKREEARQAETPQKA